MGIIQYGQYGQYALLWTDTDQYGWYILVLNFGIGAPILVQVLHWNGTTSYQWYGPILAVLNPWLYLLANGSLDHRPINWGFTSTNYYTGRKRFIDVPTIISFARFYRKLTVIPLVKGSLLHLTRRFISIHRYTLSTFMQYNNCKHLVW